MEVAHTHRQDDGLHLNTDTQGLQVVGSDSHAQYWNQTYGPGAKYSADGRYYAASSEPPSPPPPPRICGMKKSRFWIVVGLILAVIVGAVVGGAVGGTMAHRNSTDTINPPSRETTALSSNSITSSASQTTSSSTGTTTTASTTSSAPVTSGTTGIAENPCPGANHTTITASTGTLFSLFCGVDWPRGIEAADGNGTVGDLGRSTKYTLDDCIETCVQYNKGDLVVVDSADTITGTCRAVVYQANLTAVFDGGQDGNCFLKDRIGRYMSTGFGGMAAGAIG